MSGLIERIEPAILVAGAGIGGMMAALEAAECGKHVMLAERYTGLGGLNVN